ncbi:unnamed protein product [Candida verbasci]|uniref:Uncharacterized protein n=1 Tax=Candida verbasci TaxID=1227364 RepID=A0A9W4XBP1_9ASCO|nr:unnamed protein product [Candida verbasci]
MIINLSIIFWFITISLSILSTPSSDVADVNFFNQVVDASSNWRSKLLSNPRMNNKKREIKEEEEIVEAQGVMSPKFRLGTGAFLNKEVLSGVETRHKQIVDKKIIDEKSDWEDVDWSDSDDDGKGKSKWFFPFSINNTYSNQTMMIYEDNGSTTMKINFFVILYCLCILIL